MTLRLVVLSIALLAMSAPDVLAAPRQSSTGVACNSTGTARKDGKDEAGNKLNCLWDTCTYCGTTSGVIDCRIQLTEYSNPRDCKPAAIKPLGQSIINSHIFGVYDGFDSNPTPNTTTTDVGAAPKTRRGN